MVSLRRERAFLRSVAAALLDRRYDGIPGDSESIVRKPI